MEAGIYGAAWVSGVLRLVRVEAVLNRGLSRVVMVGMPDAVTRESRERLPAALAEHGFSFPRGKVLFNLYPAQWPKGGLPLDLALGVAVLVADGQIPAPARPFVMLAELDLQGRLGPPARATLLASMQASQAGATVITADSAAREASLAPGSVIWPAADIGEVGRLLHATAQPRAVESLESEASPPPRGLRIDDVHSQFLARKAATLAAAGRHALLMQGPPGTGKSMIAQRLPALLPDLTAEEALEHAQIEARLGPVQSLGRRPPFRAPHASISAQGLLGGGRPVLPGEVSRAHNGVLFLDELPEFTRPALEGLRQPLEDRCVHIQRANEGAILPASFLLVAARNPCPCGYRTHEKRTCNCTDTAIERYLARTSGPLLDRFDLFAEVGPITAELLALPPGEPTQEQALADVARAHQALAARKAQGWPARWNAWADKQHIFDAGVEPAALRELYKSAERWQFSGRGTVRSLRVARTVADMAGSRRIAREHMVAAINYRQIGSAAECSTGHNPRRA